MSEQEGGADGQPQGLLGRSVAASGRLPSLRPSRDLTLGAGQQRRTFAPNVNVKRERLAPTTAAAAPAAAGDEASAAGTSDGARGGGAEADRRPGRQRQQQKQQKQQQQRQQRQQQFVQSYSLFSEGLGAGKTAERAQPRGFGRGGGGGGGGGQRDAAEEPRASAKVELDIRQKAERSGQREFFISDVRRGDTEPIRLPLSSSQPSVKQEPVGQDSPDAVVGVADPESAAGVLGACEQSGEYFLLQLPAALPPLAGAECRRLADCPDGEIGRLQLLDNGEARLLLGGVAFSVGHGADIAHLQELLLLSNRLQEDGAEQAASADLSRLGRVQRQLVCAPDIDELLAAAQHHHQA